MKKWLALLALPFLALLFLPKRAEEPRPVPVKATRAPASIPSPPPARHPAAPSPKSLPEIPKLAELRGCYEKDCGFPQNGPRDYDFAVGQALNKVLLSLAERARAQKLRDPRIAEAARTQLETEDGHVLSAALAVLATQEPESSTRDVILQHVVGGYDAEVIPDALRELARYGTAEDQTAIAHALATAMATGSPFVAKAIAAHVAPFINRETMPTFEDTLASLPDGSVVKDDLAKALAK